MLWEKKRVEEIFQKRKVHITLTIFVLLVYVMYATR